MVIERLTEVAVCNIKIWNKKSVNVALSGEWVAFTRSSPPYHSPQHVPPLIITRLTLIVLTLCLNATRNKIVLSVIVK